MSTSDLPSFRYHPDPIATESVSASTDVCVRCEQARGFIYVGPSYTTQSGDTTVCPWCIADGSAAEALGLMFTDEQGSEGIDDDKVDELTSRTPGYLAWQQEYWEYHCDEPCAFLGRVGKKELERLPEGASDAFRATLRDWGHTDEERERFFGWLNKDGNLTGYLFQCIHCGEYQAHCDST